MSKKATEKPDAISVRETEAIQSADDFDETPGVRHYNNAQDIAARVQQAVSDGARVREVVSLDPGDAITGKLIGHGDIVDFTDVDGEEKELPTWDFQVATGLIVGVISSAQLEKRLPALKGKVIEVIRGGQKDTKKGRRVNTFTIIEHKS
jgi:hypothetical protein